VGRIIDSIDSGKTLGVVDRAQATFVHGQRAIAPHRQLNIAVNM